MAVKFLGQFLLEKGLIDKEQLLAALDAQRASNPLLGELAQACGWLSAGQAAQVNVLQRSQDQPFGVIAQSLGLLTEAQVDALLSQQKSRRRLFGEILVDLGFLTAEQVGRALEMQASERESAIQGLDIGVAGHALEPVLRAAIDTCNRLFVRTLKRRSQFSSLVESAGEVAGCTIAGHVQVEAAAPLWVGLYFVRASCWDIV
ncbi:MAG: chemotaxis protein CheX, partial [Luteimonas sp.]